VDVIPELFKDSEFGLYHGERPQGWLEQGYTETPSELHVISMHTADRYLHEREHETFMMVSQLREIEAAEQKISRKTIYHGGGANYGVARSHLYTRTLLNLVKRSVLSGGLILSTLVGFAAFANSSQRFLASRAAIQGILRQVRG